MGKEIEINGKKFVIGELKYIQALELEGLPRNEVAKRMIQYGANLSDEQIKELTMKEGIELQREINILNGFIQPADFQKPTEEKEK